MENLLIDTPKDVRTEDQLDLDLLKIYLAKELSIIIDSISLKQFSGGASNLTYQITINEKAYILRCPPKGTKAKGAHDMARESKIMSVLTPHYPYVPKVELYCSDTAIIGREFYIMEKISGIIPRANLPKGLELSPEKVQNLCVRVIDKLIDLHKIKIENTDLQQFGKGSGYANRQITGWVERVRKAKTWNVPSCEYVIRWLQSNIPSEEYTCFIHNDFRFDNVVLSADEQLEVIGILDWEMATVGDGLMDLGNSLAYWIQADDDFVFKMFRRQPTHLNGMLTRKEVIKYYCERMNLQNADFTFYEVYGLFRLLVIIQQIYFRYYHKQTSNPAFKNFWFMVNYLNWRCKRIIKQSN